MDYSDLFKLDREAAKQIEQLADTINDKCSELDGEYSGMLKAIAYVIAKEDPDGCVHLAITLYSFLLKHYGVSDGIFSKEISKYYNFLVDN